jgi:hypothetical protein
LLDGGGRMWVVNQDWKRELAAWAAARALAGRESA